MKEIAAVFTDYSGVPAGEVKTARDVAAGTDTSDAVAPALIETVTAGTDVSAARRFVEFSREKLRFVPSLGWHAWDGKRWAPDAINRAQEIAKASARHWTSHVFNRQYASDKERERAVGAALKLEGAHHVEKAKALATSDPEIIVTHDRLDADPWALNVLNGTLNLRTGELRGHRREDLFSKLAPVEYHADASHPVLESYLATLGRAGEGFVPFLARCIGATMTGDCSPESLFLVQGPGATGKTTLSESVAAMLGDYSVKMPFETFCVSRHGRGAENASPNLIRLRGARFAFAAEGDQAARLDAGVVKQVTGGEPVTARNLYAPPITFAPTWKLWLVSNFDPRADSDDSGLWRRIVKMPFPSLPEENRDPRVKEALLHDPAARSALLAWAVHGCLDWQRAGRGRRGLGIPASVESATAAYRADNDTLGEWFADFLAKDAMKDPNGRAEVGKVRERYEQWCEDEGHTPFMARKFNEFIEAAGYEKVRGAQGVKQWKGFRLHN